jgi:hypothetical protein
VAIALESASDAEVVANTVFIEHDYPNAIEYRFTRTTGALIVNNLTNRAVTERDGASATVSHNVVTAERTWFVDPAAGDLHLRFAVPSVIDQGQSLSGLTDDFDGDARPRGAGIDIGADEYTDTSTPGARSIP